MRSLIIHVADKQMEEAFRGFFSRPDAHRKLGCGAFSFDPETEIFRNPLDTDPGVYGNAHLNLQIFQGTHEHALIVLDGQFPGSPGLEAIRRGVAQNMEQSGWERDLFEVVVIDPMLEAWLWMDNVHVERAFAHRRSPSLREKLQAQGLWPADRPKPPDLKGATKTAASWGGVRSDAVLFRKVFGSSRSLQDCTLESFHLLRDTLQRWFPAEKP